MNNAKPERRVVLQRLAAATTIGSWYAGQVDLQAQTKFDTIDVGFISSPTASHRQSYLRILAKCNGVRQISVVDPTGKTLEESKRLLGPRFRHSGTSTDQVLGTLRPALTVITLEAHQSPSAIEAALRLDSHVLVEKPACVKETQFERIVGLANARRREVMLAMATRSSPLIKKARQIIQQGLLGKPYAATMDWVADQTRLESPIYQASWLAFKQRAGGGKLIFHGIHYLDAIAFLTDQPVHQISAMCANVGGQPIEVEDAAVVHFQTRGGMLGTLNTGYYLDRGKQNQIRIWGSRGWIQLRMLPERQMRWKSSHPEAPNGIQEFSCPANPGLYELFFRDAIDFARGTREPPITTASSWRVLNTVFGAYRAAALGQTQVLD